MPQVSKNKLSQQIWSRASQRLTKLIAEESRHDQTELLINSLLTKTETTMLTKRLTAFILIINDWDAPTISKLLKMSHATIYAYQTKLSANSPLVKYLKTRFPQKITLNKQQAHRSNFLKDLFDFIEDMHVGYQHNRGRLRYGKH